MATRTHEIDLPDHERINADKLFNNLHYQEAKRAYRDILAQHPNNLKTLNNLGALHEQMGEVHHARSLYRKACSHARSGSAERNLYLSNFARICKRTADWNAAVWAYENIIESVETIEYETAVRYLELLAKLNFENSEKSTIKCLEKILQVSDIDTQAVAHFYFQQASADKDLRDSGVTIFSKVTTMCDKYPLALALLEDHIIANPIIELLLGDFCDALRINNKTELTDEYVCVLNAIAKQNSLSGKIRFNYDIVNCHNEDEKKKLNDTNKLGDLNHSGVFVSIAHRIPTSIKAFYELYPYPKWSSLPLHTETSLNQYIALTGANLQTVSNSKHKILVAGCGTGRHAIQLALTFPECQVIGIDVSLPSLRYARQKKTEHRIGNLRFIQCSIFDIGKLGLKFRIIECIGVLHHLKQSTRALKSLLSVLTRDGIIKLGLYSKLARHPLQLLRSECSQEKIDYSPANLTAIRKLALQMNPNTSRNIIHSRDFYSLEGCMDLFFNPVEQQFNIGSILNIVVNLQLEFSGFDCEIDIPGMPPLAKFGDTGDPKLLLRQWHEFEIKNPSFFSQMYLFWIRPGKSHENN